MKKLILLLLLSLTACQNVTYKDTKVNAVITSKDSTKACDKYEYYYGYSMIDGHYCWHWGINHQAGWQVFAMNDNTFVLEVEDFDMGTVEYFQSDNLQDILDTYDV